MNDNDREKIALFRFAIISPILNGQVQNQKEYLAKITAKTHNVPYYGPKEYVPKTIQCWLRDYRRGGFNALKPKRRSDYGHSRKVYPELKEKLISLRKDKPDISVSLFYDQLIAKKVIKPSDVSYSTIYRIFKREGLLTNTPRKEAHRLRFAHPDVNAMWQGDFMVGPYLKIGKKKVKTHLFTFIDDCSRIIPYAMFLPTERFSSISKVFSEAILRRGLPQLLYVDNGKIYRSGMLQFACASLGITLVHTKPYDSAAKGKVERFFLTVRKRFIPLLSEKDLSSFEYLNERFFNWLEKDYHRKVHSALGITPMDKYMSQIDKVKMVDDPKALKNIFFKRVKRKVKHDRTISLNNILYEVPPTLIGKRIEVRFDPETFDQVLIYQEGKMIAQAKKVIFADNARIKRKGNISFKNIIKEGDN